MIDKKNIFIFGDIILDHYIKGEINRMTNEFSIPVPILDSITEDYRLGGAANVAHNMANLGASITLIGYININDESGIILLNLLGKMGIKFININEYNLYPTIRKTRILSGIKQICRIDKEEYIKYDNSDLIKLIQDDVINLGTADAVIFSDYAKGVITQFMVDTVLNISNNNIHPILISYDPKPNNKTVCRSPDSSQAK